MKKRNLINILFIICIVGFVGFVAGMALLIYLDGATDAPFGKDAAIAVLFISALVCIVFGGIGYYLNSKPDKEITDRMTSYSLYPEKKIEDYKGELATVRANYEADTSADKNVITTARIMKSFRPYYDRKVLSSGKIYYGQIVEANSRLFDRNFKELILPAVVVYSPDEYYENYPYELGDIAKTLFADKRNNILRNDLKYFSNVKVEESLTGGREVYISTIMVYRYHLPTGYLKRGLFPVIADPQGCTSVFIVDSKYWTEGLIGNYCHDLIYENKQLEVLDEDLEVGGDGKDE